MSPEVSARIFEPFFTTKGPGKGTGLGPVDGLRRRRGERRTHLGGERALIAGRPSRSTCRSADRGAAVTETVSAAHRSLRGTETILLVEDEQPIRELVRKVLARYGYDVLEASDVTHALEIAERTPRRFTCC